MPVRTYTTRCTGKRTIATNVVELRLAKPEGFTFTPGQFVLFDVPLLEDPVDIQTRAYSIASPPSDPRLLFILKLVPGGRASRWVEESVQVGTSVVMQGPLGKFTLDRETVNPYLFIATGTGIAPFRSQLEWALMKEGDRRPMDLLFGVLKREDLFWEEWLRDLEQRYPNLRVHVSILAGEPDWHGNRGSIQERVPQLLRERETSVYICGAPEMVKEVKELCLTQLAVSREDVHTEAYI